MTALYLFLAFGLGSLVGVRAEKTVQKHETVMASGKLCEGESITFHGADKTTTFTATKGTIILKKAE